MGTYHVTPCRQGHAAAIWQVGKSAGGAAVFTHKWMGGESHSGLRRDRMNFIWRRIRWFDNVCPIERMPKPCAKFGCKNRVNKTKNVSFHKWVRGPRPVFMMMCVVRHYDVVTGLRSTCTCTCIYFVEVLNARFWAITCSSVLLGMRCFIESATCWNITDCILFDHVDGASLGFHSPVQPRAWRVRESTCTCIQWYRLHWIYMCHVCPNCSLY